MLTILSTKDDDKHIAIDISKITAITYESQEYTGNYPSKIHFLIDGEIVNWEIHYYDQNSVMEEYAYIVDKIIKLQEDIEVL